MSLLTQEDIESAVLFNACHDIEDRKIACGVARSRKGPYLVESPLSSWLIGGQTMQGKSSIATFFVLWFLVAGTAHILLLDPHKHNKARGLYTKLVPLHDWFIKEPIDCLDVDELLAYIDWLEQEYHERRRSMIGKSILLVVIDEFNELLTSGLTKKQAERIATVIGNVARGGSKHGVFVVAIGHNFDMASSGGNAVRRNILGRVSVLAELGEMSNILDTSDRQRLKKLATSPRSMRPGDAIVKVPGYGLGRLFYPYISAEYLAAFAVFLRNTTAPEPGIPDYSNQTSEFLSELPAPGISTPSPIALLPLERTQPTTSAPVITSQQNLEFQVFDLEKLNKQKKGVHISEEELRKIIQEGSTQLAETGRVKKGDIVKALNGNSHTATKVSLVCQYMGWGLSMNTDKLSPEQRTALFEQAGYQCAKCGSPDNLTIDHITPRVKGGGNEPKNLTVLCRVCNSSKGIKVPAR